MKIVKMRLISKSINQNKKSSADAEVEQHLTISSSGIVWFTGHSVNGDNSRVTRQTEINIGRVNATEILDLTGRFIKERKVKNVKDEVGVWKLYILDDDKNEHQFSGRINGYVQVNGIDLTKLIRKKLSCIDQLYVFGDTL